MLTLELDGGRALSAVQAGAGRDIVLIHGSFATLQDWASGPLDALARLGRVTAIDRPGHGGSRRPRLGGSPALQAEQIFAGLTALGIDRPLLIGHSFGGLVALHYARCFPVAGMVLISPIAFPELRPLEHALFAPRAAPIFGPLWAWQMTATLDRPMMELIHRTMFAPEPPPPAWRGTYPWAQVLSTAGTVANGEDVLALHPLLAPRPDWSDIAVPTTVISGTADLVVDDLRHAAPLAAILPDGHHVRVRGAGHMLHHTHGERVARAVSALS